MLNRFLLLSALFAAIIAAQDPAPIRSWSDTEKLEATLDSHPDDLIVTVLRRLRAHQTVAVAPFRYEQHIVIAGGPEKCPHTALLLQGDDIAIGKVLSVSDRVNKWHARTR